MECKRLLAKMSTNSAFGRCYLLLLVAILSLSCSVKANDEDTPTAAPPPEPSMTGSPAPYPSDNDAGAPPPSRNHGSGGGPPPLTLPTSDIFAATDAVLAALPWGNIAYDTPERMNLGETTTIKLLLSPKVPMETLKAQIRSVAEVEGAQVKISNQMLARLTGNGFTINAVTQEKQSIGTDVTQWQWDVQATAKGTHQLHLTLTVVINVDGTDQERSLNTFDRMIQVEVTPWRTVTNFASSNWQWLWAVVLTPVVGWLWRRSRKRQVV